MQISIILSDFTHTSLAWDSFSPSFQDIGINKGHVFISQGFCKTAGKG